MTDVPFRVFGPAPLDAVTGNTLYTAPAGAQKFFIKDITLSNLDPTNAVHVHMSLGSISDPSKRIVDQNVTAATSTFLRPLWLMDAGETLQGLQTFVAGSEATITHVVNNAGSGTDTTAYATSAWTPAANTLYLLVVLNGVVSGTTALNPSSISGNGTWTLINQTTSTVATARNLGVAAYYFYSSTAGSSATTTVNFASTQHSCFAHITSLPTIYSGASAVSPWTSSATPIIQSAVAADTVAPGSTSNSATVTLGATPQTGYVFYLAGRCDAQNGGSASTAPSGFTEGATSDYAFNDLTGNLADLTGDLSSVTDPPWTSATVGPATLGTATTDARASIAWEMVPSGFVNCMVSGIEVH